MKVFFIVECNKMEARFLPDNTGILGSSLPVGL